MSGVCSAGFASTGLPAALADENRQREIPRRNGDDGTDRLDAGGSQLRSRLRGVVAQEIDGLAHLVDAGGHDLSGFAHCQTDERGALRFQEIGRTLEARGAIGGRGRGPCTSVVSRSDGDGTRHVPNVTFGTSGRSSIV